MRQERDRLGDSDGVNHTDRTVGPQKSSGMDPRQSHGIDVICVGHKIGQLGKLCVHSASVNPADKKIIRYTT